MFYSIYNMLKTTATTSSDDATRALAEFVAGTRYEDLPAEVVEHAKRTVADTVAAIVRGAVYPEVGALAERMTTHAPGRSLVLRPSFPTAAAAPAAFVNATASCFLELDEGCRPTGHPAIHVLPATLALAQELRAPGPALIAAFVLGYEVQARIARAAKLTPPVHCHGTLGQPAAAAALGWLSGWDASRVATAMNAAATLVTATTYSLPHAGATMRNVAPAITAQQAFTVRDLVESGFTAYDGAVGEVFGQVLGDAFDAQELTAGLGERYAVLDNYAKFHATCGGAHPALDALADALGAPPAPGTFPWRVEHGLRPEDIDAVEARTSHRDAGLGHLPQPYALSAKFSIPFAFGALIVRGCVDPAAFEGEALHDERIWRVAEKVRVRGDDALDARWPDEAIADVTIRLTDGRTLRGTCGNPYGSPHNRADPADVEAKFRWLLADLLPDAEIDALWTSTLALDSLDDVSRFGR